MNYLVRLKNRMIKVGVHHDDPQFKIVNETYMASWRLAVEMHSRSVTMGLGDKAKKTDVRLPAAKDSPSD